MYLRMFRHRKWHFAVNRLLYIFEYLVEHCLTCTQHLNMTWKIHLLEKPLDIATTRGTFQNWRPMNSARTPAFILFCHNNNLAKLPVPPPPHTHTYIYSTLRPASPFNTYPNTKMDVLDHLNI